MNQTLTFILALIKSVLTESPLPKAPDGLDWRVVYQLCSVHNVANIIAYALSGGDYEVPAEILQAFIQRMHVDAVLDAQQQAAAEEIFAKLSQKGLDYMPTKGFLLKKMYPATDLRRMSDIDILTRKELWETYRDAMLEMGYTFTKNKENEYVFKKGLITVELHRYLITPGNDDLCAYYETGWSIARPEDGVRYKLRDEDEYVYIVAHFAKHYRNAGAGIKPILDIWLYPKHHPALDWEYIRTQLASMKLLEFFEHLLQLIAVWFENAEPDDLTISMSKYILNSGEYGSTHHSAAANAVTAAETGKKRSRLRRYLWLLFPDKTIMHNKYPILKRIPVLLPVFWVYRIFYTLFWNRGKIAEQQATINAGSGSNADQFRAHMDAVGLDVLKGRKDL